MRGRDDPEDTPRRQNQTQAHLAWVIAPEELRLLQRVTRHDEEAFDALYTRYAPQVRRYLSRRLTRHDLIDDVLQEVMLVLWQRAASVPPAVPLGAWLCGVARRKALKAVAYASVPTVSAATAEHLTADDPESVVLQQDHGRTRARVLDALPYGERQAVQLLVSQGCSSQEIAAATGEPVSTIRTRVVRACHRLRMRIVAVEHRPSAPLSCTSIRPGVSVPTSTRHRAW
jgi:RNA polymerase sigma-70 factor (ECF subfamily)